MSQVSEQNRELYEERLQTQAETNKHISSLIHEALTDPKKYVPYGPVLMNIYNKQKIHLNFQAMHKQLDDESKSFCDSRCQKQSEDCLEKCKRFHYWASLWGMNHFENIHKYSYTPTIEEGDQ